MLEKYFTKKGLWILTILLGIFLLSPSGAIAQGKHLILKEIAGVSSANYPLQFGAPFKKGEISDFPELYLNGVRVIDQQVDIKNRWKDGSVKFAVVTAIVSVPAGSKQTFTFQNIPSVNNQIQTPTQFLAAYPDFDAQIELNFNGQIQTVSARAMLQNGNATHWLQGPVANTFIIADHTGGRYDMGTDNRPVSTELTLRPMFHVTVFKTGNIRVTFLVENANTGALKMEHYNVRLKLNRSNPVVVHQQNNVAHHIGASWAHEAWYGGQPAKIELDHVLPYLTRTGLIPNYDTTLKMPKNAIKNLCNSLNALPQSQTRFMATGNLKSYMPSTGGRPELGPNTSLIAALLFSEFDHCLFTWSERISHLFRSFNYTFRSGKRHQYKNGEMRYADHDGNTPALGNLVTTPGFVSQFYFDGLAYQNKKPRTSNADTFTYINGTMDIGPHWVDAAHTPFVPLIPYLLTGKYAHLEVLQNSASGLIFWTSVPSTPWGRSPALQGACDAGVNPSQLRAFRGMRYIFAAATFSEDNTWLKDYFSTCTIHTLASFKGHRQIPSSLSNHPIYQQRFAATYGPEPLQFPKPGNATRASHATYVNLEATTTVVSNWESGIMAEVLGQLEAWEFSEARPLLDFIAGNLITQLNLSNPYYTFSYQTPTAGPRGKFKTWNEVYAAYNANYFPLSANLNDLEHSYFYLVLMGIQNASPNMVNAQRTIGCLLQTASSYPARNLNPKLQFKPRIPLAPISEPALCHITSNPFWNQETTTVKLKGQNFSPSFLGIELNGTLVNQASGSLRWISANEIRYTIPAGTLAPGIYTVTVVNSPSSKSNVMSILAKSEYVASAPSTSPTTTTPIPGVISSTPDDPPITTPGIGALPTTPSYPSSRPIINPSIQEPTRENSLVMDASGSGCSTNPHLNSTKVYMDISLFILVFLGGLLRKKINSNH